MADSEEKKPIKTSRMSPEAGQFLTLGLQLAIAVVVFFFIGRWMDEKFNTAPFLTLVGAGLGITGGLVKFLRTALVLGKQADQEFEGTHDTKSKRED